jgi:hypothetical protein
MPGATDKARRAVLAKAVSEWAAVRPESTPLDRFMGKRWGDKAGSISQKKARLGDDPAGIRSESAFSLNWITSCLPTIHSEVDREPFLFVRFLDELR